MHHLLLIVYKNIYVYISNAAGSRVLTNLDPNGRDKVYCILHPVDYQAKDTNGEDKEDDKEGEENYENEEERIEEEEDRRCLITSAIFMRKKTLTITFIY